MTIKNPCRYLLKDDGDLSRDIRDRFLPKGWAFHFGERNYKIEQALGYIDRIVDKADEIIELYKFSYSF